MNKIKLLIVDDMADIRDYFNMILSKEPDMILEWPLLE